MTLQKGTFGERFIRFCNRWTPSTLVVAYIITAVAAILALILTDTPFISFDRGVASIVSAWNQGVLGTS